MASILRQIVAGPRARHPEARLDLCYVTDDIIVTSGPSSVYPTRAYRNPLDQLVAFLDKKHGELWSVFALRAEGNGYPDSEVYHRIHHFPFPDHHPPPFALIPNIMAAMRNWIYAGDGTKRVAVIHCKAGKGRSGTVATSYLISQEGWTREDALHRFTIRRMRAGFGNGVSIPSQLRWVRYVDRWTNELGKKYTERPVDIAEVHISGLRDGVKVSIEGYVDQGRRIKCFHTFTRDEKTFVDGPEDETKKMSRLARKDDEILSGVSEGSPSTSTQNLGREGFKETQDVILRPPQPIRLPTSDVNVDFERRNNVKYTGYTMVTSIAHVWWNAWFEGGAEGGSSGVFEIAWDAMDGIKGSARKGTRAFDSLKVVWKYSAESQARPIEEPKQGEPVPESEPANWKGDDPEKENEARDSAGVDSSIGTSTLTIGAMIQEGTASLGKELGLRKSAPESAGVSRASSYRDTGENLSNLTERKSMELTRAEDNGHAGVKSHGTGEEDRAVYDESLEREGIKGKADSALGKGFEASVSTAAAVISKIKSPNHHETSTN